MHQLTNTELLDAYTKAKELKCSQDFLNLLHQEIKKRNLSTRVMQ